MAKGATNNFVINSIRGGMNNQDPPQALPDDQAVLLENVEFFYSTLGERRLGCFLYGAETATSKSRRNQAEFHR